MGGVVEVALALADLELRVGIRSAAEKGCQLDDFPLLAHVRAIAVLPILNNAPHVWPPVEAAALDGANVTGMMEARTSNF